MGMLIPILLALVGLGAGVGAGVALRPAPASEPAAQECTAADPPETPAVPEHDAGTSDFVKMNNQFIIPVVRDDRIAALVVLSLSLEVPTGGADIVYQREPKLRDLFLQTLFDHANAGGFNGAFTSGPKLDTLRTALGEVAKGALQGQVLDVLITDIARQDI